MQTIYIASNKNLLEKKTYRVGGCRTPLSQHIRIHNYKEKEGNKIEVIHFEQVDDYQECKKEVRRILKAYKHSRKDEFTIEYDKLLEVIKQVSGGEDNDRVEIKRYKGRKQVSKDVIDIASLGEDAQRELIEKTIEKIKESSHGNPIVIERGKLEAEVKNAGYHVRSRIMWKQAKAVAKKFAGVGLKW